MALADLDYYSLKKYSFQVKKINSFFSIATIFATILILFLSYSITSSYVEHLWLPSSQLPTKESLTLSFSSQALTQTKICVKYSQPVSLVVYNKNAVILPIRALQMSSLASNFQQLLQVNFEVKCYSLQNLHFKQDSQIFYPQVNANHSNFKIYLSFSSPSQAQQRTESIQELPYSKTVIRKHVLYLMEYTTKDKLWVNYQPETRVMVQKITANVINDAFSTFPSNTTATAATTISLWLFYPVTINGNKDTRRNNRKILVQRYDIATIIGSYLSWFSVLLIIFGLIISPLMEIKLNLLQAETLFHVESALEKPNFLKFLIAFKIKSGIFEKEDKYVELCDKLQELKDVGIILKLQNMTNRINPLSNNKKNIQVTASQHNFDQPENEDFGIQFYKEENVHKQASFQGAIQQEKSHLLIRISKGFLNFLDVGSEDISINYSGNGYGSSQSVIISIICLLGFVIFLSLFGVFSIKSATTEVNIVQDSYSETINKAEFFLVANFNSSFNVLIVDGYFNRLSTVELFPNSQCFSRVPQYYRQSVISKGSFYFCLPEELELVHSSKPQQRRMIVINDLNTVFSSATIYHFQPDQSSSLIEFPIPYVQLKASQKQYILVPIHVYRYSNSSIRKQFLQRSTSRLAIPPLQKDINGLLFALQNTVTEISDQSGTFFDIIQNVWSFAVVCFTIILAKITKYINLRQKQKLIGQELTQFRDSLEILMSRINDIVHGKNSEELNKVKYYFKQKLPAI